MYVIYVTRVYKTNTGATEKFAPRTANRTDLTVTGPFSTLRQAQRALLAVLATHTCLEAQIRSAGQVAHDAERAYRLPQEERQRVEAAMKCLQAAAPSE